jgi:hypothetical protein
VDSRGPAGPLTTSRALLPPTLTRSHRARRRWRPLRPRRCRGSRGRGLPKRQAGSAFYARATSERSHRGSRQRRRSVPVDKKWADMSMISGTTIQPAAPTAPMIRMTPSRPPVVNTNAIPTTNTTPHKANGRRTKRAGCPRARTPSDDRLAISRSSERALPSCRDDPTSYRSVQGGTAGSVRSALRFLQDGDGTSAAPSGADRSPRPRAATVWTARAGDRVPIGNRRPRSSGAAALGLRARWARQDSNLGATDYESAALTAELRALAARRRAYRVAPRHSKDRR